MIQQISADTVDLPRDQQRRVRGILRTTRFDRVTSFLMALMLFIGTLVFVLVVVWLLSEETPETRPLPPEKYAWGTVHPKGVQRDFLEPGFDEIVDLSQPSMQDSLLAVTDAVSRVAASTTASRINQPGRQVEHDDGDSRSPGPLHGIDDVVPRFERWQLNFTAQDLESYARQLDHFGIEMGLIGGGVQGLDYASSLASGSPRVRHGASGEETRLYFLWTQSGPLMRFDRQLLSRAFTLAASETQVENRQMLKFILPELENQLARMELEYASSHGHPTVDSIAKTVFTSRPHGDGYEFVVVGQRYRKQKN